MTNVRNEFGQVLISVLTASEGSRLRSMASGIIRHYELARVSPPVLLYTDRDRKFSIYRLERISHLCRCMAFHPPYGTFMAHLSQCIFEWSSEDLSLLKKANTGELLNSKITNSSDKDIMRYVTKKELSTHVCRKTRGVQVTTMLISNLLEAFSGPQGTDTLGVPSLDSDRIWTIWQSQQKHIPCLEDPEDVQLYTKTGTLVKGGIELPIYRCVRGSTSLESFHNHLHSLIPGKSLLMTNIIDDNAKNNSYFPRLI